MILRASLIVLSLLRLESTRRCLEALDAQKQPEDEILVVDNGSTPDVVAWLRDFAAGRQDVTLLLNETNRGTSRGRNQGAARARGEWLVFVDNDVELAPGCLDRLTERAGRSDRPLCVPKILSGRERVLIGPPALVAEGAPSHPSAVGLRFERVYGADEPPVNQAGFVSWYPSTCMLVPRAVFEAAGGFDEQYEIAEEDKDFCLTVGRQGHRIAYVPEARVLHLDRDQSPEYRAIRDRREILKQDLDRFEAKWQCRAVLECTRGYLESLGLTPQQIELKRRFDIFTTVVEDPARPEDQETAE